LTISFKDKKYLAVDDMKVILKILVKSLVAYGIPEKNISQAINGVQALEILQTKHIDLIISDWNMPEMNGLELLKICKANKELKEVPFIMLTSESEKGHIVEALTLNVTGYLLKPVQKELLFLKITSLFP
jgi:CheY-like chemotaxis protein